MVLVDAPEKSLKDLAIVCSYQNSLQFGYKTSTWKRIWIPEDDRPLVARIKGARK